ncbi:hypothetical protein MNV49_000244 [Pseudohyphozyma bogoriensis]|nr:hypothetical protein MNV49_000244 [Pseudohyphozyma bogoriensis]
MPPRVLKRPAQSSQPSQPSAAPSSSVPPRPTPSSRPAKRQKLSPSPSPSPEPEASTSTLPPPPKRAFHEGKLRRLAVPLPGKAKAGTGSTLSGAKIGGKSKDLNVVGEIREEMFVTRKGIGFGGYFKKGVASFLENGCSSLTIHAMGAAIPLALSLSMAIRDALPGGTPQEGKEASVKLEIKTGTVDVPDEITPDDEVRLTFLLKNDSLQRLMEIHGLDVAPSGRGHRLSNTVKVDCRDCFVAECRDWEAEVGEEREQ